MRLATLRVVLAQLLVSGLEEVEEEVDHLTSQVPVDVRKMWPTTQGIRKDRSTHQSILMFTSSFSHTVSLRVRRLSRVMSTLYALTSTSFPGPPPQIFCRT